MGPPQCLDPYASFPTTSEVNSKPLADIAFLEVLIFQGTLSSSRSSWEEGTSSSSTHFWVLNSSTLGEDWKGTTMFLKRWEGSLEWEEGALEVRTDVIKGPLSLVLQDGSDVVFLENASSEKDLSSDKELSNFKYFSRFLGMPVKGCEEKIAMLLKKLKKMTGGETICNKRKKKWCPHHALKENLRDWIVQLAMESLCLWIEGETRTNGKWSLWIDEDQKSSLGMFRRLNNKETMRMINSVVRSYKANLVCILKTKV